MSSAPQDHTSRAVKDAKVFETREMNVTHADIDVAMRQQPQTAIKWLGSIFNVGDSNCLNVNIKAIVVAMIDLIAMNVSGMSELHYWTRLPLT